MAYCKYCDCLLSWGEVKNGKTICAYCESNLKEGKRLFRIYGWLTKEECERKGLCWEDGKE